VKAIVLTSTFLRHQHVINRAARDLHAGGVWQEEKSFVPTHFADNGADEAVIRAHFAARDAAEEVFFQDDAALRVGPDVVVRRVLQAR
jgi:hypothetical protein